MATIKEVAKLAEVSIGTVSNVLNGKTHNEELIQRVEQAMKQLSYRPDANARSLKNMKSAVIGIIMPDISQSEYSTFLQEVEHTLGERGYQILVKFSRNNRLLEKKCIESCLEQCVDGIILYSVTRKNPDPILKQREIPTVLISRRSIPDFIGDRMVIDYEGAFEEALRDFKSRGRSRIGLIMEYDLLHNNSFLKIYDQYHKTRELIKVVESSQERGFQAFFELHRAHSKVKGIIAGSSQIAYGVKKAMETLGVKNVPVVVIKESSWIEDEGCFEAQISVSHKKIAKKTSRCLLDAIERPNFHESITNNIKAEYDKIAPMRMGIQKGEHDLCFAMYDCSSSRSLQMLAQIYEKESGRKITFDMMPYKELEELLYRHSLEKEGHYDGFMMDITWLEGLIESGIVQNLDYLHSEHEGYFDGFVDGILKEYGMYVESLYAIPFMSGAQLLFYQKDLFQNQTLKLRFKRMYGEELEPPKSWIEFNRVAEFFTKKYNPKSPVKYGASIPRGENICTTISFLNHLWSYGSGIFDDKGTLIINNSNSVAALKNHIESYQFTSQKESDSWYDLVNEFMAGDSAMVILYDSDNGEINSYTKSKVAGNIGYSLVPGGTPVLGGWSLALNRYGTHRQEAEKFLLWACGRQNGIPLSLLGGSTLRKDYYVRTDLENLQPWKPLLLKSYQQSKKRVMPEILDESRWKNNIYTSLIPHEIMRVLEGTITEKEAIEQMEISIRKLIES